MQHHAWCVPMRGCAEILARGCAKILRSLLEGGREFRSVQAVVQVCLVCAVVGAYWISCQMQVPCTVLQQQGTWS